MTTNEEAKALLDKERKERIESCTQAINKVLEQHKCQLDVQVILRAGQVIPRVDIVVME